MRTEYEEAEVVAHRNFLQNNCSSLNFVSDLIVLKKLQYDYYPLMMTNT